MKQLLYPIIATLIVLLSFSCGKEELLYQGEEGGVSGIYFYSVATTDIDRNPLSFRDSVISSFQNDILSVKEKIVEIPVKLLGDVSIKDRVFKVKLIGGTAQEGVDFEKLAEEYIMPAGKATTTIKVKLYRTAILLQKSLTVDIQLVENENFKLLLPYLVNIGNNQKMDATKFRVNFSEIITEFSYYSSFGTSFFGDWSIKKFKILNDLMGWTTNDWRNAGFAGQPVASGKFAYAASVFKEYLLLKLKENDPVYEDDGVTFMQLGPSYMVDYSGFELSNKE